MYINMYFDTEFTGLRKGTDLLSIGCLIGSKFFYGEIMDADIQSDDIDDDTSSFLEREVYPGMLWDITDTGVYLDKSDGNITVRSTKQEVGNQLIRWLNILSKASSLEDEKQIFIPVSDVMYYDMVLLMDLLSSATDSPVKVDIIRKVSPAGIDINDMIRVYNGSSAYIAFDVSREALLEELIGDKALFPGKKHNALYDARVIQALYRNLNRVINQKGNDK